MERKETDCLLEEATALALYVSRYGDSLCEDKQRGLHKNLLKAITEFKANALPEKWENLLCAYAQLTAVTYKKRGVNGRTIRDTQIGGFRDPQTRKFKITRLFASRFRPMTIGVIFFVLALVFEVLMNWTAGVSDLDPLPVFQKWVFRIVVTLSGFMIPALWGGIGACIFLAKRISDMLFDMAFEEARMRGGVIRIFLGSMLGVVTVVLFFPNLDDQIVLNELTLAPAMVAFVAGLGVKPVYAAFESLSEELARRVRGRDPNKQA